MIPTTSNQNRTLLSFEEVCVLTRLSLPTLRRYVAAGKFPAPIRPLPAGKSVRFIAVDVHQWMARLGAPVGGGI